MMRFISRLSGPLLVALLIPALIACFPETAPPANPAQEVAVPGVTESGSTGSAEATLVRESDADPTLATPPPTETPAPTATSLPTPTPTLNPLTIQAMRERSYPGSDLHIEQTLTPGANYDRYIASYLSDGLKIYGLLTVPRGDKPATGWPVIIFNHGYIPPTQYRTTERYVDYVDRIARAGYIVFKSDYRGHGNSEGVARGGYYSPDYTVDVLNALSSVKKYPDADPNRIGMWGHSMGGYITLRALVIDPEIKAASIWSGVVGSYPDMLAKWHHRGSANAPAIPTPLNTDGRNWRNNLIRDYGTPQENPEFWASISANSFLADVSAPIQLHHSTTDPEVPVEFSKTLYQEILAVDGTAELYLYDGDNHNLSKNFSTAMARTIQFFDKYVAQTR